MGGSMAVGGSPRVKTSLSCGGGQAEERLVFGNELGS